MGRRKASDSLKDSRTTKLVAKKTRRKKVDDPCMATPSIDDRLKALKALVACHQLLDEGLYQRNKAMLADECMAFLKKLHGDLLDETLKIPESDSIPELKALKKERKKDVEAREAQASGDLEDYGSSEE